MKKKIVFIGLSGGVDSAVSATLLKKQGFEVVGVFMRTWHPDFLPCNEEEERLDAMRVATHLNIPFLTFDFEKVYKKEVADYMIAEYKAGRTPNPDVMCNKEVKFGAFLKKALSMGADYVATGHYARIDERLEIKVKQKNKKLKSKIFNLKSGLDPAKDQSYFLWTLNQKQLSKILFPIGHLKKRDVRVLAKKYKLPVAEKKDSQGICFLGEVDLKEFLKHYIKEKKGKVLLTETKEIVGHHMGVVFSTLGERRGFTITKKTPNDKPYYVIGKDIKKNILYVSQNKNLKDFGAFALGDKKGQGTHDAKNLSNFYLQIKNVNWIGGLPKEGKGYTAQIRYHGEFLSCQVICGRPSSAKVFFEKSVLVASGQSIVLYDKDVVLGGGIVV
ncbi:tRNA 2-thiouridine(34) synthase MnmA [Candidatus Nomurabacteria bacterium RIFCSPLOWO2_01_FULL_41_21]|uniref:tRNA-specific 2-thiouridylase MnmA n=2 Tax=Candidatus Nomuraibacteriota TaxID=1752729 RepID=A0A1F6V2Y9_9BACT|nr:MAG: tRNA 2-thiouridine(34) synthase MnmA [Candidatus Nomurabacteria bacterium RIFCSPHIGHO2_01_FULL_40_20]OGI88730.1 MAG: tRNA 2-thiouridine(34) synthase MnmA [Candidatus Nomurabacteria bacterium RIFCSPLOWO2_01_FULL_41_21]